MNPKWAEENLQTIRTLMERSAVYRRALAPVMIFAGLAGVAGGVIGWLGRIDTCRGFVWLWMTVALFSLAGSLLLVRRQALKDSEPFWSPPTRRVSQALLPAFFVGLLLAVTLLVQLGDSADQYALLLLQIFWCLFYGCAVHAAGFFMPRGIRWLGWVFIAIGAVLLICFCTVSLRFRQASPNLLMGGVFGGLHLAYGVYLYFTEKKHPAA